jgi:hypothetical protein
MPVTHERPMRGGIDRWGFNKFMSDIRFIQTSDTRTCEITIDGEKLISFTVKQLNVSERQEDLYVFNKMKDLITRTLFQFKGDIGKVTEPDSAEFTLGEHPIARTITSLQLEQTPDETTYGVNMKAILHPYEKALPL